LLPAIQPKKVVAVLGSILPTNPKRFMGFQWVRFITFLYLLVVVARSTIHLVARDGGAESIAGIDISGSGGRNIVALFHQWGAIQLLLAALMLVLFFAYPGLTPLVILFMALDAPMRALAGLIAPVESARTPPGEALNWPVFFVLVALFALSLVKKRSKL
jgi:hypothetical protein